MRRKEKPNSYQAALFGDGADVIASAAEVRELAREYFNVPTHPDTEPPLLKAKRRLHAHANGADKRGLVAK